MPEGSRGQFETAADERRVLLDGLRQLPARQRAAVVLRHYEGYSGREVAAIMNCAVGTVKSLTSRDLTRLRTVLGTGAMVSVPHSRRVSRLEGES